MTSEPTQQAFVWVWLPDQTQPVVAGKLINRGPLITFTYGRSYLARSDAIALFLPELPLRTGEITPVTGDLAGCMVDAGPDSWGRRIIEHRDPGSGENLGSLGYLLLSGSNRIGALDFQTSATEYLSRPGDSAQLSELAEAAERLEQGLPLSRALDRAILHGTSVGGARPKAILADGRRQLIAKFGSVTDWWPVVQAEYLAMELARLAGLKVAAVELDQALGKNVLLVERFDRTSAGTRRMMVSAMTILELHDAYGIAGRYGSYADLAHQIRARFSDPEGTLRELFSRIVFNILVGNTDDHARNQAAFWNGAQLTLTPAYDIAPQSRTGGEAVQAMAYGPSGQRLSQVSRCVDHATLYYLTPAQAQEIADHQIATIHDHWNNLCERARLTKPQREWLWGRQFLNPFALEGYGKRLL
ncbi:MAG: HipA domain-containing protein [Acidimicrobiia bacterium]|nr:HipA domain-containing protein [Acidimicrobiia bacterium]MYA38749.1 HipA domain-containing protein [Acidimicrobiia bacterium]MYH06062.1 HipA domain-containing protein [Acidimicrobiia bacterium]MYK55143.1 HipA domain-containing protein [Acidimicrobiia bacterium]